MISMNLYTYIYIFINYEKLKFTTKNCILIALNNTYFRLTKNKLFCV